jgi:hypothetical protein
MSWLGELSMNSSTARVEDVALVIRVYVLSYLIDLK